MADRKQFLEVLEADEELVRLLDASHGQAVPDDILREQRVSFAFGNALNSERVTKETVRHASNHVRLIS